MTDSADEIIMDLNSSSWRKPASKAGATLAAMAANSRNRAERAYVRKSPKFPPFDLKYRKEASNSARALRSMLSRIESATVNM